MENIQYLTNILSYHLQCLHHLSYNAVPVDSASPQRIRLRPALMNRKAKEYIKYKSCIENT